MGIVNQKAIKLLEIAGNQARTGTSLSTAAAGEVFVTDGSGTILDTVSVVLADKIMIMQSQGSALPVVISPVIKKSNILTYKGGAYVAPVQGISYIGYNGSTGSIDVVNDNAYTALVYTYDSPTWAEKSPAIIGYFASDSAATEQEIADGLTVSMYQNKKNIQAAKPFTVERVNSGAAVGVVTGTVASFSFVEDSSKVLASVATATITGVAVGDYIRVGTAGTLTNPIYKVTAVVSGGTSANPSRIELDVPWDAASTTQLIATVEYVAAATAQAGDFGLKLTGRAQPVSQSLIQNGGLQEYYFVRFKPNLVGFGATSTDYNNTVAVSGSGVPAQVGVEERQLLGNEGFLHPGAMPFQTPRSNTNFSALGYSFIHLEWTDAPVNPVLGLDQQPKQLDIALEASAVSPAITFGTNIQGASTSVWDVLESWLVTNGSFSTAVIN